MCGICGEWSVRGVEAGRLSRMQGELLHRGPDGGGQWLQADVGLAARRLAIVDLARGGQPMANEDGDVWVVCNGEIYNHGELRRDLLARGHRFRSAADTEVLVHLYEEHGEDLVHHLRGMFAFALYDTRRRRLLLARDRVGQKPLFYRREPGRFLFASEPKAILAALDRTPPLDAIGLDSYLALRFVPSPRTLFEGIHKLPPAHLISLQLPPLHAAGAPEVRPRRYWELRAVPKRRLPLPDAVAEVRDAMEDAVESHRHADVPVGALLSGGLDSSLVVALLSRRRSDAVPAFSVGVGDPGFDELPYARAVARHCGAHLHEEVATPDVLGALPRIVRHLDEPSDPVAACMYEAARLASRHVKVVLTGDGGDEVFAGYDRYFGFRWVGMYARLPEWVRRHLLGPALGALPESGAYKSLTQQARWVHQLSFSEGGRRFALATAFFRFGGAGRGGIYQPRFAARLAAADPLAAVTDAFDSAAADTDLDRMLLADLATRLPEHSLALTDRMTMAHGLEARSPLLDHLLIEKVATLPARYKLRGRRLKLLARLVARDLLPPEIVARPKQGFMFPLASWLKGPLRGAVHGLARSSVLVAEGILDRGAIELLAAEHDHRRADHHARLWLLLNLEVWFRMYQLGQEPAAVEEWLGRPIAA